MYLLKHNRYGINKKPILVVARDVPPPKKMKEALEQDLQRIQAAGLWCAARGGGEDDGGSSDSGSSSSSSSSSSSDSNSSTNSSGSGSDNGDKEVSGSLKAPAGGTSPLLIRQTIVRSRTIKLPTEHKEAFVTGGGQLAVSGVTNRQEERSVRQPKHEKERKRKRKKKRNREKKKQQQTLPRRGLLSNGDEPGPPTIKRLITAKAVEIAAASSPPGSPKVAASAAGSEKRSKSPKTGADRKKRGRTDSKMVAVLVQKEQEAAAQAEALTKAAKMAEENAAMVVADARDHAKELIQASTFSYRCKHEPYRAVHPIKQQDSHVSFGP